MYLTYADESGDPGVSHRSPTKYFVLSGITIHETKWQQFLNDIITLRRWLKNNYGLKIREEIHASEFVNGGASFLGIPWHKRIEILRLILKFLASKNDYLRITTVAVNKELQTSNVFEYAWRAFLTRFDKTIGSANFPIHHNIDPSYLRFIAATEKGIIFPDNTDGKKLTSLTRKIRHTNWISHLPQFGVGSYNNPLKSIIEDPILRDSKDSYFHQMVDVVAYFARQKFEQHKALKRKGVKNYYDILIPVINSYASPRSQSNIVLL